MTKLLFFFKKGLTFPNSLSLSRLPGPHAPPQIPSPLAWLLLPASAVCSYCQRSPRSVEQRRRGLDQEEGGSSGSWEEEGGGGPYGRRCSRRGEHEAAFTGCAVLLRTHARRRHGPSSFWWRARPQCALDIFSRRPPPGFSLLGSIRFFCLGLLPPPPYLERATADGSSHLIRFSAPWFIRREIRARLVSFRSCFCGRRTCSTCVGFCEGREEG
jgi:hypothetical protein